MDYANSAKILLKYLYKIKVEMQVVKEPNYVPKVPPTEPTMPIVS